MADRSIPEVQVIKVPASVAKVWQDRAREAISGNQPVLLGSIQQQPQSKKRILELTDNGSSSEVVQKRYRIEQTANNAVPTYLFSSTAKGVTLEGRTLQLGAYVEALSEEYKASTATANKEATAEKFFTKKDTSLIFERQGALNKQSAVTKVQKHVKISKAQFETNKQEIEGNLFELFKEKPAWKTADVARILKLNNSQASQMLAAIATKVQSGPLRGEWSLKPEYRQDTSNPEGTAAGMQVDT